LRKRLTENIVTVLQYDRLTVW